MVQGLEASAVARYQGSVMASQAQLMDLKDFPVGGGCGLARGCAAAVSTPRQQHRLLRCHLQLTYR